MKRITGRCMLLIGMLLALSVSTFAEEFGIEQVRVYAPLIKAYYYGNEEGKEIQATLDGKKLSIQEQYESEKDPEGTDYYVLLDTSRSLADAYLPAIRGAVAELHSGMHPQDTLTILTFGDEVKTILERADGKTDLQEVLDGYTLTDQNTHLFEAFEQVRSLADCEEYAKRRVLTVVFTDGEDCSTNETSKTKAIQEMNKLCIPVYAMAVSETRKGQANAFVEEFGDFARSTNGEISVFTAENGQEIMHSLIEKWNSVKILELEASSNRITGSNKTLTLLVEDQAAAGVEVMTRYHQKDTEIPTAEAEQIGADQLKIVFSEKMTGADSVEGYEVTVDAEEQDIISVEYAAKKHKATLTFAKALKGGEAQIRFVDITDDSQEENAPEDIRVTITAEEEVIEEEPIPEEETEEEKKGGRTGILIGAGAGLLLLILLLVFFLKKKGKAKEEEMKAAQPEGPADPIGPGPVLYAAGEPEAEMVLNMLIRGENNVTRKVRTPIRDRLILGRRSADCDIAILDANLSKKHMAIEREGDSLYAVDLQSTNGTRVNGVPITERTRLHRGDSIEIGSQKIQISWQHPNGKHLQEDMEKWQ